LATGVPTRLTAAEGRRFGVTVGFAFLALAAVFWWRGWMGAASIGGGIGGILVLAAALIPARLGPVQRAWMGFALALSRVTTPVFMSLVFFTVLTPVGLLKRRFRGNAILRPRTGATYWVTRPDGQGRRSDLERQF
jgi:hypothetical protein